MIEFDSPAPIVLGSCLLVTYLSFWISVVWGKGHLYNGTNILYIDNNVLQPYLVELEKKVLTIHLTL